MSIHWSALITLFFAVILALLLSPLVSSVTGSKGVV